MVAKCPLAQHTQEQGSETEELQGDEAARGDCGQAPSEQPPGEGGNALRRGVVYVEAMLWRGGVQPAGARGGSQVDEERRLGRVVHGVAARQRLSGTVGTPQRAPARSDATSGAVLRSASHFSSMAKALRPGGGGAAAAEPALVTDGCRCGAAPESPRRLQQRLSTAYTPKTTTPGPTAAAEKTARGE
eukprot:TRINITY_DN29108_c0_g1_i3.p2 TRINITY_DN29108_c0_g1~~TRINITY_DN29108_c0_g1_i3.p2  ORF type:complete len:188 (-),score=29.34 TRINITY_DN29108_c0_g1_i3:594-1157(-)